MDMIRCNDSTVKDIWMGGWIDKEINVRRKTWGAADSHSLNSLHITEQNSEKSRSGGKMAAGAVIGGMLTGGIGLLVGGALGSGQKETASFLIEFDDGTKAVVESKDKEELKCLRASLAFD